MPRLFGHEKDYRHWALADRKAGRASASYLGDKARRDSKWEQFGADAEWQGGKIASERDGPLLADTSAEIWSPTSYSDLR